VLFRSPEIGGQRHRLCGRLQRLVPVQRLKDAFATRHGAEDDVPLLAHRDDGAEQHVGEMCEENYAAQRRGSAEHMVPISLATGQPLETKFRPSSDTPTHHELYRAFPGCGGVAHTHSDFATAFAQSRTPVTCMGTTHADYFRGDVPVTRPMTREEVETDYERNTGLVIVEAFATLKLSADDVTAVLVANHGPFAWGKNAADAVERAEVLEYLARIESMQRIVAPGAARPADYLISKHFNRKHGKNAYYGQK